MLQAQTAAALTLDKEVVKAGSSFVVTLTLDKAPSYDGNVDVVFSEASYGLRFDGTVAIHAGQARATITVPVATDISGGVYTVPYVLFSAGQQHTIKVPHIEITVIPSPETVTPAAAALALSPTQEQFLNTRVKDLQSLLDELSATLAKNGSDEVAVRARAASLLETARKQLLKTAEDYKGIAGTELSHNPVFFDDFDRQYRAAIIDLNALGISAAPPKSFGVQSRFTLTAYQAGTRHDNKSLVGSLAADLSVALSVVKNNVAAYSKIADSGSDRFKMTIRTIPSGATISYRRIGFDYADLSKQTDLVDEEFDFALWTFRIHKGNCEVFRNPNPYLESNLDFSVNLTCDLKR